MYSDEKNCLIVYDNASSNIWIWTKDNIDKMSFLFKSSLLSEINKIINEMLPTIKTNLTQSDILDFSTKVINISLNSAFGFPYKCEDKVLDLKDYYEGTTKGKDSYTVPLQLTEDVKRLHQELFKDNEYNVPDSLNTIWENIKTQGKVK